MTSLLCNLGLMDYREAYDLQTRLVDMRLAGELEQDVFLIVEHPSVYTLGRRGGREFLTVPESFLAEKNIPIVPIERGGVITYHGPGQLVLYPILHLKSAGLTVTDYVDKLEEVMAQLAAVEGVTATRDERNHGVWVGNKKLGSVGIAIRHGVSFHGLAININPDMAPFGWINPCGLAGIQMTSLALETSREVDMNRVLASFESVLNNVFSVPFTKCSKEQLPGYEVKN